MLSADCFLSARRPAAVNQHGVTGDERSSVGSEEHDRACDLHRLPDTVQRGNAFHGVSTICWDGKVLFGSGRVNESRSYGINGYVVLAPFDCKTFCEVRDAGFGHAINAFSWKRRKSSLRTHVDD